MTDGVTFMKSFSNVLIVESAEFIRQFSLPVEFLHYCVQILTKFDLYLKLDLDKAELDNEAIGLSFDFQELDKRLMDDL